MEQVDDITILHKVEEFPNLPWDKLDPERCSYDWSFGWGGYGNRDRTLTISIPDEHDDCLWHIWVVPEPIVAMMNMYRDIGVGELKNKFKALFDIE